LGHGTSSNLSLYVSDFLIVVYHHPTKMFIVDFLTDSQKVFALLNAHKSKSLISMKTCQTSIKQSTQKKRGGEKRYKKMEGL
jgi:hypothetical protein